MKDSINIIGGLPLFKTISNDGNVNRGIIEIQNNKVTKIKEMLNISRTNNPELMEKMGNVNFIGLQNNVLNLLNKILMDFKKEYECIQ